MIRLRYQFLILTLAVWLTFANSLSSPFIMDDASLIVHNPRVHSLRFLPQIFLGSAFFDPLKTENTGGQFYRPAVSAAYSFLYALGGPRPWLFHLFQIHLHLANTLLVLLILRRFLSPHTAAISAAIFAVHPINQMTVVYISQLNDVLYLFFGLSAFWLLISRPPTPLRTSLVHLLLLASLLSKETGFLFVITVFAYLCLYHRARLLSFFHLQAYSLFVYFFLRLVVARVTYIRIPDIPIMRAPLTERLLTAPKAFWYYLHTFFFPLNLHVAHWWTVNSPNFSHFFLPLILSLVFATLLVIIGRHLHRRHSSVFRPYLFFCFWFASGVGLHLQLVPLDWTVLDPWFYFPQIGLFGLAGIAIDTLRPPPRLYLTAFLPLILLLSLRTLIRNRDWRTPTALFTHDLTLEDNGYLHAALAAEFLSARRYSDSIPHWQKSIELNSWGTPAWYNLGYSFEQLGDNPSAETAYRKFLSLMDTDFGHEGLLTVVARQGSTASDSATLASQATSKHPLSPRLWLLSAIIHYQTGDSPSALTAVHQASNLSPSPDAAYVLKQITSGQPIQLNNPSQSK